MSKEKSNTEPSNSKKPVLYAVLLKSIIKWQNLKEQK
jgi:hypothetical protein